ncbi:MAG: type II secretion system F family protein [Candidatus Micrarchaeota archaeon]|nr:type II secretion system F family protein [Candidatus Micrarchaeota archaeon]
MAVSKDTLEQIRRAVEKPADLAAAKDPQIISALDRLHDSQAEKKPEAVTHVDFSHVSIQGRGFLSLMGTLYGRFGGFFRKLASLVSKLPLYGSLRANMLAGGMTAAPESYLVLAVTGSFFAGTVLFALVALLGLIFKDPLVALAAPILGVTGFVALLLVALSYPSMKAAGRASQIDRTLPFALRQLSTQVRAGVSFNRAMQSIASSDYGLLSEEFAKVVSDVNRGDTLENALVKLSARNKSKGLRRTVTQLLRSFKSGGNLSQIISDIANDVSFEVRMGIRDFTEKLNFINVIYIMVGVVAPVTLAILSAILQIPLFAGSIPPFLIYFAFVGILGVMVFILIITKRMEPASW